MAARTLTYTINLGAGPGLTAAPKAWHTGLNVIPFDFNSGATKLGTLSDMVLLGKIPNGALVTEGDIRFGAESSAASTWTMLLLAVEANGTFSTFLTLQSTGSITAAATAQTYHLCSPQKVSLSDDRAVQYCVLALNCTVGATETVSFSFQGSVKYLMDGSNV
jgi:hypothetical protein